MLKNFCDWDNPESPANKANIHAVFLLPWEVTNAFHAFHDNVMAVLAEVIVDYLHTGGTNTGKKYTLYQHKYWYSKQWRYYDFESRKRHTRMYDLLPIIFGEENVLPASSLLEGGPHCVKHLNWATARRTIHSDALVDIRRAIYDVLHHILHSYTANTPRTTSTTSTISTTTTASLNNTTATNTRATPVPYTKYNKPSAEHKPRVMIVSRAGSPFADRMISTNSELALVRQYEQAGFQAEVCCNFTEVNTIDKLIHKFQDVDICVGIHGAGLANCVLGKRGVTIVELQTSYGYGKTFFHKLAHMAYGQHIFYDIRANPAGFVEQKLLSTLLYCGGK
mgnify:FL=1